VTAAYLEGIQFTSRMAGVMAASQDMMIPTKEALRAINLVNDSSLDSWILNELGFTVAGKIRDHSITKVKPLPSC
jgi:hypothetical protein